MVGDPVRGESRNTLALVGPRRDPPLGEQSRSLYGGLAVKSTAKTGQISKQERRRRKQRQRRIQWVEMTLLGLVIGIVQALANAVVVHLTHLG